MINCLRQTESKEFAKNISSTRSNSTVIGHITFEHKYHTHTVIRPKIKIRKSKKGSRKKPNWWLLSPPEKNARNAPLSLLHFWLTSHNNTQRNINNQTRTCCIWIILCAVLIPKKSRSDSGSQLFNSSSSSSSLVLSNRNSFNPHVLANRSTPSLGHLFNWFMIHLLHLAQLIPTFWHFHRSSVRNCYHLETDWRPVCPPNAFI